ncbi:ShlB/FhaC/HecB family hemolysin secretion/activation protein [Lonepinella sp. BR2357]|uniref:ShlB/FhaC/HecB family hemolysin secretion/activation protein n=1 Tax=Lonepinella sp. BR2357 TaxID=3434549 RepID=UPI003F6DC032
MLTYNRKWLFFILTFFFSHPIYAQQETIQQIEQQNEQRQQARQKQLDSALQSQPDIKFDTSTQRLSLPPTESPCFPIQKIALTDYAHENQASQFSSLLTDSLQELNLTLPYCFGGNGLSILMKTMQNKLIEKGLVTTRVIAEEQDLNQGELKLTVILGRLNNILVEDSSDFPTARFTALSAFTAMAIDKGDILNVRDIEQSLENLKRIPTADANIEILPANTGDVGYSDLKISYAQSFPFRLTLGLDDGGSKSTGKYQGSATLSVDNLLTANDLFYSSFTRSIPTDNDEKGTRQTSNFSLHYSIPFGYWLLSFNSSYNHYRQQVFGYAENYLYSGQSRQQKLTLSYLLHRDAQRKTTLSGSLWARQSNSFIDDEEIDVQRRRTAGWEVGIKHREYLGQSTFDIGLSFKRGTGAWQALAAPEELFNEGTSHPKIILANATLTVPFSLFDQIWQYQGEFNGQWNKTPLTSQDRFSIGGRYSVRGFDGELTLSGNRGWSIRNDVSWLASAKIQPYLGVDYGKVYQQIDDNVGNALTGAVLGLRGQIFGVNYDAFVGRPIDKPAHFRTSNGVAGFNLSYQF